jgi:hypothetical protein
LLSVGAQVISSSLSVRVTPKHTLHLRSLPELTITQHSPEMNPTIYLYTLGQRHTSVLTNSKDTRKAYSQWHMPDPHIIPELGSYPHSLLYAQLPI